MTGCIDIDGFAERSTLVQGPGEGPKPFAYDIGHGYVMVWAASQSFEYPHVAVLMVCPKDDLLQRLDDWIEQEEKEPEEE
jgi:hypothetical protein